MAEVTIELELNRRSGVLASAIAALRHLSLSFLSQQLVDRAGTPGLILNADGQIGSLNDVEAVYASVRGVAAVIDVRIEGESVARSVQEAGGKREERPMAQVRAPSAEAVREQTSDGAQPSVASTRASDPKEDRGENGTDQSDNDRFIDDVFAQHVLVEAGSEGRADRSASSGATEPVDDSDDDSESQRRSGLKPAVFRRRRRYR